jgi:glycine/D-amino acid oxidase-like deaminating enzyme
MRIAVVGGGLAGALLAWRLRGTAGLCVELFTGRRRGGWDATAASGGLVRGFEPAPESCRLAALSLAELRGSPGLRTCSGYRETGSVYLLPAGVDPSDGAAVVDELLPGSVTVRSVGELTGALPFRALPEDALAVVEAAGGYLSPARMRQAVLHEFAAGGGSIRAEVVSAVSDGPGVRLGASAAVGYDLVVLAAGPWTVNLLADSGLPAAGLRTKLIQYTLRRGGPPALPAFVDDVTGLYGRPADDGCVLLGLPSDRWHVQPDEIQPDPAFPHRVVSAARRRLVGTTFDASDGRTVAGCDCYTDPPGLILRSTAAPGVLTFTGGSGGAAKTALAASREAAVQLLAMAAGAER